MATMKAKIGKVLRRVIDGSFDPFGSPRAEPFSGSAPGSVTVGVSVAGVSIAHMAAPAYWLMKTEPDSYSWDDLVRDGRTVWDGITNPLALKHVRSAAEGDLALVYHTGDERRAVGIAKIVRGPHPDPKLKDPKRVVVAIAPVEPLKNPVTLAQIKSRPVFAGWDLLRISRLSFLPVPPSLWKEILRMSEE